MVASAAWQEPSPSPCLCGWRRLRFRALALLWLWLCICNIRRAASLAAAAAARVCRLRGRRRLGDGGRGSGLALLGCRLALLLQQVLDHPLLQDVLLHLPRRLLRRVATMQTCPYWAPEHYTLSRHSDPKCLMWPRCPAPSQCRDLAGTGVPSASQFPALSRRSGAQCLAVMDIGSQIEAYGGRKCIKMRLCLGGVRS